MSRPFCSTGEPWDKEADGNHSNEIWEIFRDEENGDIILWLYGPDNLTMELRMNKAGGKRMAATLVRAMYGDRGEDPANYLKLN